MRLWEAQGCAEIIHTLLVRAHANIARCPLRNLWGDCRLARDAAAAAAAKEAEANKLKPNPDEHAKALQPLEAEHSRLAK